MVSVVDTKLYQNKVKEVFPRLITTKEGMGEGTLYRGASQDYKEGGRKEGAGREGVCSTDK